MITILKKIYAWSWGGRGGGGGSYFLVVRPAFSFLYVFFYLFFIYFFLFIFFFSAFYAKWREGELDPPPAYIDAICKEWFWIKWSSQ